MDDCLFCKIFKGEIPSTKVYEDLNVIGFQDLYPQSKIHLLFIHKEHSKNVNEMMGNDPKQISDVFSAIKNYSEKEGLEKDGGFRVVTNLGSLAGQTVFHTHFHVLSGEQLGRFGS